MSKPVYLPQITIEDFPKDGRIWRISWFGYFDRDENFPSEKIIKTVLVPLAKGINPDTDNLNKVSAYEKDTNEKDIRKIVPVNIGLLPALKLGSFWQQGKVKNFTDKYNELTLKLNIDARSTYITDKAKETDLFRDDNYPYIKNFENSRLLVIKYFQEVGKNTVEKIIIPCVEVLRFYYASSSQLTRILINGQLAQETTKPYNTAKSSLNNGSGYIHLHKTIPDTDAPHVARLAFDKYAENQAVNIYDSGVGSLDKIGNFFIDAKPPFQGKTLLKLEGKFVKSSKTTDNTWNFLVFEIKSCSYPFPFSELTFGRDNDGRSLEDKENKPDDLPDNTKINIKTVKHTTELNISNKGQPSANFNLTELMVVESSFPDLIGKKISKVEKEKNNNKTTKTQFTSSENNGDFSIGAETYGKTDLKPIAAIRDIPKDQEGNSPKRQGALAADFSNFTKTISELSNFEDVSHHYIKLKFDKNPPNEEGCSFFPLLAKNKWVYINLQEDRQRQFITVEINYKEYFFYFFEIESDKFKPHDRYSMFAMHSPKISKIDEKVLKEVIIECTKNYGRWLDNNALTHIRRKKFKHTSTSTENCAKKFYNYLTEEVKKLRVIKGTSSVTPPDPEAKDDIENYGANTNSGKIA